MTDTEPQYPTDFNILEDARREIDNLPKRQVQKMVLQNQKDVVVKLAHAMSGKSRSDIQKRNLFIRQQIVALREKFTIQKNILILMDVAPWINLLDKPMG